MAPIIQENLNKDALLRAVRKAIELERKTRYADFQGKRTTFSVFMRQTAARLSKRYPLESTWITIRGLFRAYVNLDVSTRISVVRRAEELLAPHFFALDEEGESKTKPISVEASEAESSNSNRQGPANISKTDGPKGQKPQPAVPAADAKEPIDPSSLKEISVQFVKGVGPKMVQILAKLGISNVDELLKHYPRRHLDFKNRLPIKSLEHGQEASIIGMIRSVSAYQSKKRNVSILTVLVTDGTGSIAITRFIGGKSNKFLLDRYKDQFPKGAQVLASGVVERDSFAGKLQLKNAEIEILGFAGGDLGSDEEAQLSLHAGRLVPVYPLTEGLSLRHFRSIVHNALEKYGSLVNDTLPVSILEPLHMVTLREAYKGIHFPDDEQSKDEARQRLVFDELFSIQLQMAHRRYKYSLQQNALELTYTEKPDGMISRLRAALPYTLTGAQERVFGEIARDLADNKPMHRLVQGDVGSGKTIVAILACLVAIENGFQVAVMAPTEILAEQHYRQFQNFLTPLGLNTVLVIGKQGAKQRREIHQALYNGQAHIAVGTHALLEDAVEFQNLGLIVIDEQHRFGVKQRARLKVKSKSPELLTMTATPIPRTLAMTIHGDLDVSEIDELPPGRKPIDTRLFRPSQKKEFFEVTLSEIARGRQAYIVFPLIDESETLSAKAATKEFEKLQQEYDGSHKGKPKITFGLMHGKLAPAEKDAVMERFRDKEFQVLVTTTVVEVGVDVPNATVMIIENADRFGLAQLHQLRGRVGRNSEQSFCFLVSEQKSQQTRDRLEILTKTNDGFVVAEKDLEIRGPGEFLGFRQSGLPDLILADLVQDTEILELARNTAISIIKEDPELDSEQYKLLKPILNRRIDPSEMETMRSG
ncbi:MAG: ATP-dependent DNA helicase RecG [Candidatus Melainabacteria bacterium]|nr:ATP-dependent DNA helicase RecG [Candidatus Melainabacteria bacterium]